MTHEADETPDPDPSEGTPATLYSSQGSPHSERGGGSDGQRERVAKRLNGAGAAVLILEALVVLFVPRAIAQTGPGLTATRLSVVLGVAVLLIVVAGLQRRTWGARAGLAVQLLVLATGFFTAAMWVLGVIFLLVWIYLMRIRAELLTGKYDHSQ